MAVLKSLSLSIEDDADNVFAFGKPEATAPTDSFTAGMDLETTPGCAGGVCEIIWKPIAKAA